MKARERITAALCVATLPLLSNVAVAGDTDGGGDDALFADTGNVLTALGDFITGDFAAIVSLVGFVIAGAVLIWGNDLSRFGQSIFYVILVISLIVFAANIIDGIIDGATLSGAVRDFLATTAMVAMIVAIAVIQTAVLGLVERRRARKFSIGR